MIDNKIQQLSTLIDNGKFQESFERTLKLLKALKKCTDKDENYYLILFNISGILIDIGGMEPNEKAANIGLSLIEKNKNKMLPLVGEGSYYYNLSNGKSATLKEENLTFTVIEKLIELKTLQWRSLQHRNNSAESFVNLGIALKRQFRISEALYYFDKVNDLERDIPQSWVNRSETLMLLNDVSGDSSIQMFEQVKKGYEYAANSKVIPPQYVEGYKNHVSYHEKIVNKAYKDRNISKDSYDHQQTIDEYEQHSSFRRFCLKNSLTLFEHGLYCQCVGSERDNLTIPTLSGISGDFIVPMEMVLNRLKSEFSLARRLYYEYVSNENSCELLHESCFSELNNDELLGVDMEKLRTAFRLCFGILDKIGVAICELYDLYPSKDHNVYFQNFWQLDKDNRREKFDTVKTSGLLALYSIATDLNEHKQGELAFFKQYRNDLEHKFVVVHKSDSPYDLYGSYKFFSDIVYIKESEFVQNLEQLFQLTRSAIFSFVFMVREDGKRETDAGSKVSYNIMLPQNYLPKT